MVIRVEVDRTPATVSLTDTSVTIGHGDSVVVAWDRAGRLYSTADDIRTCRRGLNGRVLVKWRASSGRRERAWASDTESDAILDGAAALAARLSDAVVGANRDPVSGVDIVGALQRAAAFDSQTAREDARAFGDVYQPIGILPPDQYLALVLQGTEGCSFRSCTFCDFYRTGYRVRSAAEFREHVRRVRQYLGASMSLRRRSIFLGSANVLAVPTRGLLTMFDLVATAFPAVPICAFVDGFTGSLKTVEEYRRLAEYGLRRVYIGLESGHDPLLALVHKPASSAQAIDTVHALKASGVAVGVIVMLGLGGDRFADAHVHDSARVVTDMHLDGGDLLYFSELVDQPGSEYGSATAGHGVRALGADECTLQRAAIESALSFRGGAPKITTYDIREFVY